MRFGVPQRRGVVWLKFVTPAAPPPALPQYDADERRRMPLVEAAMMALWVGWLPVVVGLAWLR